MKGDDEMNLVDDLWSVSEAAKELGVDRTRANILCRQGRFAGAAKIGRNWVIPREAVENFQRLKPGVKSKTKQQREEDRTLIAQTLEELKGSVNDDE